MVSKSRTIAADIAELTLTLEPGKDPGGTGAGNRGKTRLVRLSGLTQLIAGIDCAWRRAAHEGCPQMPVLNEAYSEPPGGQPVTAAHKLGVMSAQLVLNKSQRLPGSPGGFARRLP
jgi:hypothetical protein